MATFFLPRIPRNSAYDPSLLQTGWGTWWMFMLPPSPFQPGPTWVRRENGLGWSLRFEDLWARVPDSNAGIYELGLVNSSNQISSVVYVGKTQDQDDYGRLVNRMYDYMTDGSHKSWEINGALHKGYGIAFRFKTVPTPEQADFQERILLEKYEYPWNVQHN